MGWLAAAVAGLVLGLVIWRSFFLPGPIHGDLGLVRSDRQGLRVLFIGNSFTARNSMITMVRKLSEAQSGSWPIFTVEYAPGGSTLRQAARDGRLARLLEHERWNAVVLQEQSEIPGLPGYREQLMFPAAARLDAMARRVRANTILFMTWGYEGGDRRIVPADTYRAMQKRVDEGYFELRKRLPAAQLSPVGFAWGDVVQRRPSFGLWSADGRHPSQKGSYLAACVFYALLSGRDPMGNRYTAGLDGADARWLQEMAELGVRQLNYYYPATSARSP
jgi:hypothetical protein